MAQADPCWFPEPHSPDPTPRKTTESTLSWLGRSTWSLAVECRRFLNFNLAQLPTAEADSLTSRLREDGGQWKAAFFELIVGRTLQALGAEIEIEPQLKDARRPDFKARFASSALIVEATAPSFHQGVQDALAQRDALVKIVEEAVPQGWMVWIHALPHLGPAESKRRFRRTCRELLNLPPPQEGEGERRLTKSMNGEAIEFTVLPQNGLRPKIAGGPAISWCGDGVETIHQAVRRKRPQVRAAELPVILAINASELTSCLEDFDQALFGHWHEHYDVHSALRTRREFVCDGALTPRGVSRPAISAVLAFVEANWFCSPEPILYLHPRFQGELPCEFKSLQWRTLDRGQGVQRVERSGPPVMAALQPVRHQVRRG